MQPANPLKLLELPQPGYPSASEGKRPTDALGDGLTRKASIRKPFFLRMQVGLAAMSALALVSCGWFRSSVNNSPGLRWWLFSNFGAQKICPQVLSSGIGLRLNSGEPIVGRFFPNRCEQRVDDARQTVTVAFGGTGFAWTPVAGRMGFAAQAAVEYKMDFRMTDDAIYVFAVPASNPAPPQFQLGAVENKVVDWAAKSPVGYLANVFGTQILASQLAAGFTVIRTDNGDEFALGHLEPPARAPRPFGLSGSDRVLYANDTTLLHPGQIDVLGPFEVTENEQALYLRFQVEGAAIEGLIWPKAVIDPWREGLQTGTPLMSPPQPALGGFALNAGVSQQRVPLARGVYVLILDETSQLGTMNPPFNPLGMLGAAGASRVSYAVELGDANP